LFVKTIKLKNYNLYDLIGSEISNLTKINFIYGANGSGKTTLSNFIANQDDDKYKDCSIEWEQDLSLKVLVYNKEFRDKNFGKDSIDGIFTLGQATKEDKELIQQKQLELNKIEEVGKQKKATLEKQKTKLSKQEEEFKEWCWDNIFKKYKDNFKEAFQGVSGKKISFKEKLLNEFNNNTNDILLVEELDDKAKTIFGEAPQQINEIYNIEPEEINTLESNEIWARKIIGKSDVDIAQLIQKLNLNDWVNQGRKFITEDEICPFCQQKTITKDFRKQLEDYFDQSFTEDIEVINKLAQSYLDYKSKVENQLLQIIESQKNNSNNKLNLDIFIANFETLKGQFLTNEKILNEKL